MDHVQCVFAQNNPKSKIVEATVIERPVSFYGLNLAKSDILYDFGDIEEVLYANDKFYGNIEQADKDKKAQLLLAFGPHLMHAQGAAHALREGCDTLVERLDSAVRPKAVSPASLSVPQPARG